MSKPKPTAPAYTVTPATSMEYEGHEILHDGHCIAVTCTEDPIEVTAVEERRAQFIGAALNAFDGAGSCFAESANTFQEEITLLAHEYSRYLLSAPENTAPILPECQLEMNL